MKAEILKIAGVKSEKEFYKKFPTEEAFMKAHSKEFRKAKLGAVMAPKAIMGTTTVESTRLPSRQESGIDADKKNRCRITEAYDREYRAAQRAENKEYKRAEIEWKKGQKEIAETKAKEWSDYINPDLNPYGEKYGRNDKTFMENYNKFISANPQFVEEQSSLGISPEQRYAMLYKMAGRSGSPTFAAINRLRNYMKLQPTDRFTDQQLYEAAKKMGGIDKYAEWWKSGFPEIPTQKQGGQTKKLKQLTSYEGDIDNIIPTAQGGIGLNSPAGGTMNVPASTSTSIMNQYGYNIPGSISGGTPADQFAGMNTAGTQMDPNATGTLQQQIAGSAGAVNPNNLLGKLGGVTGIAQTAGELIGGIRQLREEKQLRKQTEQGKRVSELTLQASGTRPEQQRRRYNRPEDSLIQPNQLFPSYGVGTNYLAAKHGATLKAEDGMQIGGNLTEIQNTYAPNTLYDDLGFEPLNESDIIKRYYGGGYVPQAKFGIKDFMNAGGEDVVNKGIDTIFGGGNAGGRIGGTLGKTAGNLIGGPIGGMIGGAIGKVAGNLLDPNARKIKQNQEAMQRNLQIAGMQSGAQALQGQYSAYVKDGGKIPHGEYGWVSHDWQPQKIVKFGEHRVSDLLKADPTMDTLRTGGNIRQNEMFPTDQFNFGGELQTTWGGYAEPISQNPYLPGTGQTVMFRGNSHEESDGKGRTGIGVKYGNDGEYSPYMEYGKDGIEDVTDVEVERNEPASELIDPETGEKNMVVYGNLKINRQSADEIGDPKAQGKKFKHYVKDLSKKEARQNKIIEKASKKIDEIEPLTSFDKLTLASLDAMQMGAHMNLKDYAEKKINASIVQNAINETAEEYGLDADALARGKIKTDKEAMKQTAQNGRNIPKAQKGIKYAGPSIVEYLKSVGQPVDMKYRKKLAEERGIKNYKGTIPQNEQLLKALRNEGFPKDHKMTVTAPTPSYITKKGVPPMLNPASALGPFEGYDSPVDWAGSVINPKGAPSPEEANKLYRVVPPYAIDYEGPYDPAAVAAFDRNAKVPEKEKKKNKYQDWITAANTLIPYLRPTDQEPLDPNQLMGEMFALSANALEPVPMQTFQPQLLTPYDISYQDQLNEITAQARDAMRMAQGDPSALAAISAQAELAKSKVLGEQFRQNQAQRMGVYNENINTLNQAQLQNLGLYDKQYERQATARSKTKATAQEALNSIADKIQRNRLENRTLGIYENLYNYRFDPQGRAINMNPLVQFDATIDPYKSTGLSPLPEGYEWDTSPRPVKKKKSEDTGRNGKIVRAIKNL